MKICLLIIATNKYTEFLHNLCNSADMYFCNNYDVEYFIFTNKTDLKLITKRPYKIFEINHESWPNVTLKRYHIFSKYKEKILEKNYVYYCDSDMKFVNNIKNEIFSDKVVTIHPGFYNKNLNQLTYERNKNSTAYISYNSGKKYYAGGFNGGKSEYFLKMSEIIKNNVDIDLKNNIIAKWHDESHLNYYYNILESPTLELSPSYCYPESWNIPFDKKILALDKNHKEYHV